MSARYMVDKSALARMPLAPVRDRLGPVIESWGGSHLRDGQLAKQGKHRLPILGLIVAAAAEEHRLTVLHYDRDFDQIAKLTAQPMEWVVPRGSV